MKSERSLQFKRHFIELREGGKSVKEIADSYNLSRSHAYSLVRELAVEMGVDYEALLTQPHSPGLYLGSGKLVQPVKAVDFSGFEKEFRNGISSFDKTIYQMDAVIKKWPTDMADLEEDPK